MKDLYRLVSLRHPIFSKYRMSYIPAIVIFSIIFCASASKSFSQVNKDFAVMVTAVASTAPSPQVTISWKPVKYAKKYAIYRKNAGETYWTKYVAETDSTATSYVDDDAALEAGKVYEYFVQTISESEITLGGNPYFFRYAATGYICTGIEAIPTASYGKVLLLVDNTIAELLNTEISRLTGDLVAEGWTVVVRHVGRTEQFSGDSIKAIKKIILTEYSSDPVNLSTVFLLGRVAVPYSGEITPDGHTEQSGTPIHTGAWAADVYYADINETMWSDFAVSYTKSVRQENRNVPFDGKFDQSIVNWGVNLQVGRVDFYNMPAFYSA